MQYFIGYLIEGDVANWHIKLEREISEKFQTWRLDEFISPHVTLFRQFETDDISPVKELIKTWANNVKTIGSFSMSDFGNFPGKAVFVAATPDQSVKKSVEELREKLNKLPIMPENKFPNWNPHATLAYRLTPEEDTAAWNFVQTIEKPNFVLPFSNVTLFSSTDGRKWFVDETFRLK